MSKFDLKEFLGDLCKSHAHLKNLYEIIKKHKFEHVLTNRGNFTFIVPNSSDIKKISEGSSKIVKKKLLKLFVPGKYKSAQSWPEKISTNGINYKIHNNRGGIVLNNKKLEFAATVDSIPVWNSTGTLKHGGAFKSDGLREDSEPKFLTIDQFSVVLEKGGIESLVAKIYEKLSPQDQETADCFINCHPLAELFLLYDSPFISSAVFDLDTETDASDKYREICSKTGKYLINSKNEEQLKSLFELMGQTSIISNEIDNFYTSLEENKGVFELDGKNVEVICPLLAPYLRRISLFVCMIDEYEKVINESDSLEEKYNAFLSAFSLNATTNIKVAYTDLVMHLEADELYIKNKNIFATCGGILFKSSKVQGAREKRRKKHIIKLTPATRKILTSSASSNK